MKKTIPVIIILLIANSFALACSCIDRELDLPIAEFGLLSTESEKTRSIDDYIFRGELILSEKVEVEEIRSLSEKNISLKVQLNFRVIEAYKGEDIEKGDIIILYTESSSDACGFFSPLNTNSIIFATSSGLGKYFTYRGDCCKSVSEALDKKRYDQYVNFIEVIKNKIDGKYEFYQPESYWEGGWVNENYTKAQLFFEIKDGEFNNEWKVVSKSGIVLEHGYYSLGKRTGVWKLKSIKTNYFEYTTIINTEINYVDGLPTNKRVEEIRRTYNFETEKVITDKTIRIESTEIEIMND